MNNTYNFDEKRINNLLDEINSDRVKLFSSVKNNIYEDAQADLKIKSLDVLTHNLIKYRKLLVKEKDK